MNRRSWLPISVSGLAIMCALGLAACAGSSPVPQAPPPIVRAAPAPVPEGVPALSATEATPDPTPQPTAVAGARLTPAPPRSTPTAAAAPRPTVAITAQPAPPIITAARLTAAPALTPVAETTPTATPAAQPTPTPPPRPPGASVGRLATTREIDGLQRPGDPVTDFRLGERIYISVEFIGVRAGTALGIRWSSPGGCRGAFEKEQEKSIRRGFFGFFIDDANCLGRYAVDITVDGESLATTSFNVERP
jgi:hypothetical protein